MDAAQREPVVIRRHNRDAAGVISPDEYDRLRGLNVREFQEFCERIEESARQKGLTEDKDLLVLDPYLGIPILSPSAFLDQEKAE